MNRRNYDTWRDGDGVSYVGEPGHAEIDTLFLYAWRVNSLEYGWYIRCLYEDRDAPYPY